MKTTLVPRILVGVGLLLFGAGCLWTVVTIMQFPARHRQLERKQADLTTLQQAARAHQQRLQYVRVVDELPRTQPPELAPLLQTHVPRYRADIRHQPSEPVWAQWQVRRPEIVFDQVSLSKLSMLLAALEQARPPWLLREIDIRANDQLRDTAHVTMILEGLEKGLTNTGTPAAE